MREIVVLRGLPSLMVTGMSLLVASCAITSESPDQLLPGEEAEESEPSTGGNGSGSGAPGSGGSGATTSWSGSSGGRSGVASGGARSSWGSCDLASACVPGTVTERSCGVCGTRRVSCTQGCEWDLSEVCVEKLPGDPGSCSPTSEPGEGSCEESVAGCSSASRVVIQSADTSREWSASLTQDRRGPLGIRSTAASAGSCGANFDTAPTVAYSFVEVSNDTSQELLVVVGVNSSQVTGRIAAYASLPRLPGGDVTNEQARAEWDQCLSGSSEYSSFYQDCPAGFGQCLAQCSSSTLFAAHPRRAVSIPAKSSVWIYVPQVDTRGVTSTLKVKVVSSGC